jgi:hypothetical protein
MIVCNNSGAWAPDSLSFPDAPQIYLPLQQFNPANSQTVRLLPDSGGEGLAPVGGTASRFQTPTITQLREGAS